MKLFIFLMFLILAMAIKANAKPYIPDPKVVKCNEIAQSVRDQDSHKYKGILYKNDEAICLSSDELGTFVIRTVVVLVKNSKKASDADVSDLQDQYRKQLLKDFCPGVKAETWKALDFVQFAIRDLDNTVFGKIDITQKDCKSL